MEIKVQLSDLDADILRIGARRQGLSMAQFVRDAIRMKHAADRDGVSFFKGEWVKQQRITWREIPNVIRE